MSHALKVITNDETGRNDDKQSHTLFRGANSIKIRAFDTRKSGVKLRFPRIDTLA